MTTVQILRLAIQNLSAAQMSAQAFLVTTEAAIQTLQHALTALEPPPAAFPGPCPHPKDQLSDRRTMGFPNRYHCQQCDQEVDIV